MTSRCLLTRPTEIVSLSTDLSPLSTHQRLLFARRATEIVAELGVRLVDMERLHEAGLMRVAPWADTPLDTTEEAEIRFLASLVRAGCDVALIRALLSSLEPPYAYDIHRMVYDFAQRRWLCIEGVTAEEALDHAVGLCEEEGDLPTLIDLGRTVLDAARVQARAQRDDE